MLELRVRGHSPGNKPGSKEETAPLHGKGRRRRPNLAVPPWHFRLTRTLRLRWSLLSPYSRGMLIIFLPFLCMHFFFGTIDLFFHHYGSKDGTSDSSKGAPNFSVVINTYKRPTQLAEAVQHYAETCGKRVGVDQVFIIWAEKNATPPETSSFFSSSLKSDHRKMNRSTVNMVKVDKDSLNSRFLPLANQPSEAIFMVDDDIKVDCYSLRQGFVAWKSNPHTMVGYYPRLAEIGRNEPAGSHEYVYYSWPTVYWRRKMNFILTKASFLHRRYMDLYSSSQHPQEIKDYVDKHFNCEDLAMSMLVANVTRSETGKAAVPIYVEGSVSDKGLFGGISTGTGHMSQRSKCLTDLSRIYEERGWKPPLQETSDLRTSSWVRHAPGLWWQNRPSNIFEWFALGNIFK